MVFFNLCLTRKDKYATIYVIAKFLGGIMAYIKFNHNPLGKKTGDCVIRAFAQAFNKDWDTIYDELCVLGKELKDVPNGNETYTEYLQRNKCISMSFPVKKGQKRLTPKTFSKKYPEGSYILRLAHHLVAVTDGNYYDIWNSGNKAIYKAWRVN